MTAASSTGAALGVILLAVAARFNLDLSELEAGAIVVLATALGGYLVKPGAGGKRARH